MDEDRKQIKHMPRNTNVTYFFVFAKADNFQFCLWPKKGKGKAVPLQAWAAQRVPGS